MFDAQTVFVAPNSAFSLVGAAGATVQVGNIIDLLGWGVGTAPPNIIGNRSVYGVDPGIGFKPVVEIDIGTVAPATANGMTMEFAIQYAPDQGAAGGYQPGTWEAASTTGSPGKAVSEYPAGTQIRMDVPPAPPSTPTPRYMRIVLLGVAAENLNAGTVAFAGITISRTDLVNKNAPNNFVEA